MPRLLAKGKRLKGSQVRQFREALLDAFDLTRFDEMLLFQRSMPRERIALGNDLESIVLRVIERAEMESWTAELLQAARASDPQNIALFTFAQQFGLATKTDALERKILESNKPFDPVLLRKRVAELEPQICRVELHLGNSPEYGTGFLLGPDIVMTNYHVMEKVIKNPELSKHVTLRFDYKTLENGITVNEGTVYRLPEEEWLIHASQYNEQEKTDPGNAYPSEEELDYTLLRVDGEPGNDPLGGEDAQDLQAPARGWIPIPVNEYSFEPDSSLFIFQHPEGSQLKLAMATQAIVGLNQNRTRVRYRTNTEPGSSGSPCFDADWNLVALHHLGDPNYNSTHKPEYNQGIPFMAILDSLEKAHKKHLLTN